MAAEGSNGMARRQVLRAGAVAGLAAAGVTAGARTASAADGRPDLEFADGALTRSLGGTYRAALANLLDVNTVRYDPAVYNRTGLMTDPPGTFIRAGGGYEQPWTRDAATNSWNAASLLSPDQARNTLWSVCQRQDDDTLIVQQDNQWWDRVIWAVAAWNHFLLTGDHAFLADAYQAAVNTMRLNASRHRNPSFGLFEGPAFMQDGIAGYPSPPYDPANPSSFVLDHPHTDKLMCLSTNCVYHLAYGALAAMADALGRSGVAHRAAAARLRVAINRHLWRQNAGTYGYFIHGAGASAGTLETYQEGAGLAFAVLSGVASPAQVRSVLATTHHEPHGVVNVWPSFARFDATHPGRHNAIVWPMVVGMWGHAAAAGGNADLLARSLTDVAILTAADGHLWELYNAITGVEDGGWQTGTHWPAQPDQTWSATGYLRMVHAALFGLTPEPDGLRLAPTLPADWAPVTLHNLRYRAMTADITLTGAGTQIAACTLDGHPAAPRLPATLTGHHTLTVALRR